MEQQSGFGKEPFFLARIGKYPTADQRGKEELNRRT
jgi:hypothetical protein